MSVSAVSRAVQRLEEELDCRLFDRDRRGIRLTTSARQLVDTAEGICADWQRLRAAVIPGPTLAGELRIYCSVTATHRLLSPVIATYRNNYSGVQIKLITGDQADGVERVLSGDADVAVVARPSALQESLSFQPLASSAMSFCYPKIDCEISRSLRHSDLGMVKEAANLPWILPERGVSREIIETWLVSHLGHLPTIYARVAGHEAIVAMVSLGLGVAVVPELVVEASAVAESVALEKLASQIADLDIGLCARSGRLVDPVIAALWELPG